MAEMMAYAAAVGSALAQREAGAVGFVGCAADATARFFGQEKGLGTMPHALIGYAGSTVRAAEMFREVFPNEPMTVLIDYFGHEISDALAVARRFPDLAAAGRLSVRMDTPGGRYCEGLDPARSYEVIERHAPQSIRGYRTEEELRYLVEMFGSLYDPAERWQAVRELKALQDSLGEFQDAEVQLAEIHAFATEMLADHSAPAATLLAMGEIAAGLAHRQRKARNDFDGRFAAFASPASQQRLAGLARTGAA